MAIALMSSPQPWLPVQDQANQQSSMESRGAAAAPLLLRSYGQLDAADGRLPMLQGTWAPHLGARRWHSLDPVGHKKTERKR